MSSALERALTLAIEALDREGFRHAISEVSDRVEQSLRRAKRSATPGPR
jgi:hypothetical protein